MWTRRAKEILSRRGRETGSALLDIPRNVIQLRRARTFKEFDHEVSNILCKRYLSIRL